MNGAKILTATHTLSSAVKAIRKKFGTLEPLELIVNTLRLMGEGTKVCSEITLMAADAGVIPADKDVVAVGGGKGGFGLEPCLDRHFHPFEDGCWKIIK